MTAADPYDEILVVARQGCCDTRRKPCERHDAYADGLEAGLAAAAVPPEDLPPGVHRIDGDLYLCLVAAREAMCLAQMTASAPVAWKIDNAVRRVDAIGTERLSQWSDSDCNHTLPEAPPAPAEDLPPGVHRIDGDLWLLPGNPLPDGWEYLIGDGWCADGLDTRRRISTIAAYRVRPTPAPATEVIDTRLAKGRTLPDGQVITMTGDSDSGMFYRTVGTMVSTFANTVEVLLTEDGDA